MFTILIVLVSIAQKVSAKFGVQEQKVTLAPSASGAVEFSFKGE